MDSTSLRDQYRSDVDDLAQPYLWSDSEFFVWLDEAQRTFCRKTFGLGDASSPLTKISYVAGEEWKPTSALILKFRDAYLTADGRPLGIVNYENLMSEGFRLDQRTGHVRQIIIGIEPHKMRLYPIPTEDGAIQLLVDRLPLKAITDEDQQLEIDPQHHLALLDWVKFRAYDKQDAETQDASRSQKYEASFRDYCAIAKRERERAMHKTRVVAYGGIGSTIGGTGARRSGRNSW